jgi:hypothetical protein
MDSGNIQSPMKHALAEQVEKLNPLHLKKGYGREHEEDLPVIL